MTFAVFTTNRPKAIRRQLSLLGKLRCPLLILDGSDKIDTPLKECVAKVNYIDYFWAPKFWQRSLYASEHINTPFAMTVTDDDLFVLTTLSRAVKFMRHNSNVASVVCAGATLMMLRPGIVAWRLFPGSQVDCRRNFNLPQQSAMARVHAQATQLADQLIWQPQTAKSVIKSLEICGLLGQMCTHSIPFTAHDTELIPYPSIYCLLSAWSGEAKYLPEIAYLRWGADRYENLPTWLLNVSSNNNQSTDRSIAFARTEITQNIQGICRRLPLSEDLQDFLGRFLKAELGKELKPISAPTANNSFASRIRAERLRLRDKLPWMNKLYFQYITSEYLNREICKQLGVATDCFAEIRDGLNKIENWQLQYE
jgi:hypothetical protein